MEGEALRLTANDVESLEKAAAGAGGGIRLWLDEVTAVDPIRAVLAREGRGRGRVVLVPRTAPGQEVEVALPGGFNIGPRVMQAMKVLPGVSAIEEI
jgi:DNA polymerase-3 subunit alpha